MSDEPVNSNTAATLLSGIERVVSLKQEIAGVTAKVNAEIKDEMAALKSTGFDTKIIRKVIARSLRDARELAEEESLIETYESAIETAKMDRSKTDKAASKKLKDL